MDSGVSPGNGSALHAGRLGHSAVCLVVPAVLRAVRRAVVATTRTGIETDLLRGLDKLVHQFVSRIVPALSTVAEEHQMWKHWKPPPDHWLHKCYCARVQARLADLGRLAPVAQQREQPTLRPISPF